MTLTDEALAAELAAGPTDKPPRRPHRATKAAPKPTAARARPKSAAPRPGKMGAPSDADLEAELRKALDGLVTMWALAVIADPVKSYDATIIGTHTAEIAAELMKLAKKNPAVRSVVTALLRGAEASRFVVLLMAIAVPILANHGVLPPLAIPMLKIDAPDLPPRPPKPAKAKGPKNARPARSEAPPASAPPAEPPTVWADADGNPVDRLEGAPETRGLVLGWPEG